MKEEILDQLKEIIINKLDINISKSEIKNDVSLFEDGIGLDSIAIVQFIVLIEEHFKFKFQDNDISLDLFKNLDNLSDFIKNKLN